MFAQVAPQMVVSPVVATTLPPTISSSTAENVAVVENQLVHVLDELEAREVNGRKMEVEVGVLGKKLAAAKHQMGLLYNDHLEKVDTWEEERGKLKAAAMEAEQRLAAAQAKVEEYEEHLDNLGKGGDLVQKKMAETARRVALLRANEALLSRKYKVLENQQMEATINLEEMNKEAAAMEARSDFAIFVSTLTLISFRANRDIASERWIPALPLSLLIWVSKNFPQIRRIDNNGCYLIRLALREETWLGDFLTMETYK